MKSKTDLKDKVIGTAAVMLAGFFLVVGACFVTGNSTIGTVIGLVVAFLCVGAMSVYSDTEKRQACADVRKEMLDQIVDNTGSAAFNGKQWKKGYRIDPDTCQVIEPGA